jgi:hypothetical protein
MQTALTKAPSPWQTAEVQAVRDRLVAELDRTLAEAGASARLDAALTGIEALEHDHRPIGQLQRWVLIVAALAHHARWGGLGAHRPAQLLEAGEAILLTHGVERATSSLGFMWGELHLAYSQVLKQAGQSWESAWQQHYAQWVARCAPAFGPGFQALATGSRALRLGFVDLALRELAQAETAADSSGMTLRHRDQARLLRIQALRISGDVDAALQLCADAAARPDTSEEARLEADWEHACCLAQRDGDLDALVARLGRSGSHRHGPFLLEGFLWTRASASRRWDDRLPLVRSMRRLAKTEAAVSDSTRAFYAAVQQIEDCYETGRPLATRLDGLGEVLARISQLPSVDKELLVLAAAFRWLARAKQPSFAALVLAAYQARSRVVTSGRASDALGLVADAAGPAPSAASRPSLAFPGSP